MPEIESCWIEVREHAHDTARIRLLAQHIKFLDLGKGRTEVAHRRKVGRFDDDAAIEDTPGMIVEVTAHHFAELRPLIKRRVSSVSGHDALAILFDKGDEISFLLIG